MSDSPRSSRHTSRTPSNPGSGEGGRRRASSWVAGSGTTSASRSASRRGGSGASASGAQGASASRTKTASASGSAAGARSASRKASAGRGSRRRRVSTALNYPRAHVDGAMRWWPSWRLLIGAAALFILLGVGGAGFVYATTSIPAPQDVAVAQTSTVYYADGKTKMGTFSDINRTILPSDEIPQNVKDAVVASEDSTFYENRGISPKGILRALINNLSGGARQGGSTITQQYVERYYTGTDTSYLGKVREMFMAVKIDQELSKDEILSRYLNTIYFGRGAYGIEAASQAYFGKGADKLDDAEAAMIVALIPAPSAYDPAENPDVAGQKWSRVIERQVTETATMSKAEADTLSFPEYKAPTTENKFGGTKGYLLKMAESEMKRSGLTQDEINTGGFKIVTTIDKDIQDDTVAAIKNLPSSRPKNNHVGTVTIDPDTGGITAMYGGKDFVSQARNDATQSHMQAGSIFKTFALLAAIDEGYGLYSSWDGNSPKYFPGWTVNNFNHISYGTVTLAEATTNSINTAYAELNIAMGPKKTRDMAVTMGLPKNTTGLDTEASNVLGTASPTVINMASAYATIAAQGIHRTPHIIDTVTKSDGTKRFEHKDDAKRVIDKGVAINATVALQGPPSSGSARYVGQSMGGRQVAGKTGTSESFRSAWFVGFTPQLVTAVGMFQPSADGKKEEPLTSFGGVENMTGGQYPTRIWVDIMRPALEGAKYETFPSAVSLNRSPSGSSSSSDDDDDSDSVQPARTTQATRRATRTRTATRTATPTEATTTKKQTTTKADDGGENEEDPSEPAENDGGSTPTKTSSTRPAEATSTARARRAGTSDPADD